MKKHMSHSPDETTVNTLMHYFPVFLGLYKHINVFKFGGLYFTDLDLCFLLTNLMDIFSDY